MDETEKNNGTDGTGFSDVVVVELNGARTDGVKGPDPAVWGPAQARPPTLGIDDNVKGPDPEIWCE